MNSKNTSLLCALLILFLSSDLFAQISEKAHKSRWLPDSTIAVVPTFSNPAEEDPGAYVSRHRLRAHQGTDKWEKKQIKDSLNLLKLALYQHKGMEFKNHPDSITVTENFTANPVQNFTPMDNTMAISPEGYIVSAVNANWCIFDEQGDLKMFRTFQQLANDPSLTGQFYDPRVVHDPESGRFIMTILYGVLRSDSRVLIFVSKEKNPALGWHVYSFSGNPFSEGVFADYPHLSVSADHVWVSVNQFGDQDLVFKKSLIYVLNKDDLTQGANANANLYNDLKNTAGKNVFSMIPAPGIGGSGLSFLSSDDRGGEELYLFYLEPDRGIQLRSTIKTVPYSLPPDAIQLNENTLLDAGDCRITGTFYRNGLIHFCLNTRGVHFRTAIYYGRLDVSALLCEARTIISTKDLAYGSPVSFAAFDANRAVLIPLVYSSENEYPSIGYVYLDDGMKDHSLVSVYQGLSPRSNNTGEVNRWGDYCTAVPHTRSEKPVIWFAASATITDNRWQNFLVRVEGDEDSIRTSPGQTEVRVYPNPVGALLKIELKLEFSGNFDIVLYDDQGKQIEIIWSGIITKGNNMVIFEPRVKASGLYYVRVLSGKNIIHTETLFIE